MKTLINTLLLSLTIMLPGCKIASWFTSKDDQKIDRHKRTHSNDDTQKKATAKTKDSKVALITSAEEFDKKVLQAEKPVVADFFAVWCSACLALKPIYEEIAKEMRDDYDFVSVDVDKAEDVAKKYGITGIPTILFFKNGKEVDPESRHIGLGEKEKLKKLIESAFKK